MSDLILFWHRRDLRITDNVGLAAARQISSKVVGVFCLDRNILNRDDIAPARVSYMVGCLQELQASYAEVGSQLLVLFDRPSQAIPNLAEALQAKYVFWNWDVEPYSQERDRAVTEVLKEKRVSVRNFWDQLLHSPAEIHAASEQPYTVYTPFWKKWSSKSKSQPAGKLQNVAGLTGEEAEIAKQAGAIALPTAKDLGFIWERELVIPPGELAAKARLEEFCQRAIFDYREQRDFPGNEGTSRLSAALKFGVIGIRTVWAATVAAKEQTSSKEARIEIETWQKELAWREFYQHVLYHFPQLADGAYRELFKSFPWDNNEAYFQAWREGKTGYPIVDAAMRQLNTIGWMHNRCRMIVASFLTKDLIIDIKWGEKYFMQKLIDGDLSANNGGWQWSASSGMDAQPLRIFNPYNQAQKFDPEGVYIRRWLPELRSLDTTSLLTGNISPLDRQALGYPAPIVEHNRQQRLFKECYQQQKLQQIT
jgi:deoxyribodipyrimidine photo-lyase